MAEVFDGITVLDFTQGMAGSLATMVLSDFGAEVIKVEPPGGEPFRGWPGALQWNRGKKSIILDLKTLEGRRKVRQLARQADVVVESFRPGVTKRLGISYETLSGRRPDLIYCSLTGFGPTGPYASYKGYEGIVAAKCGRMMAFAGLHGREGPSYSAVQVACYSAATAMVRGIIAALYVRDRTGRGQKVETSLLQAITPYDHSDWLMWQMMIRDPEGYPEDPWAKRGPYPTGYLAARTKDGRWLQLANIVERLFHSMIHSMDMDFIYQDPRLKTAPVLTDEERDVLRELMLTRIREKTLNEWMELFAQQTSDVAAEPFMSAEEGMDHPQVVYNGHVQEAQDPRVGRLRQLGPLVMMPLVFKETPGSPKGPAPEPGQHTEEILARLNGTGRTKAPSSYLPMPRYPLEGVTVLDLCTVIAGPFGCSLLAELGARVIHIEGLEGDFHRPHRYGLVVHRTMAGTQGLCLNLKAPEGREVMQKLVARADILVHSMRPGAPERTGIGYEQVSKMNPRLVYVYAAGYGSSGPHSHRPSMHPIPGAVCGGALAQMGRGTMPPPEQELAMEQTVALSRRLIQANEGNPDLNSSMAISLGALLGLYARERTGRGQYIESTMLAANAYANADDFFMHAGKLPRLLPDPNGYGLNALYRLYRVRQGWIFLACPFEEEWQALCQALGRPDLLEDPRFATRQARQQHDAALADELGQIFAARDPLEWEKLLTKADVACVKAEDRGMYHFYDEDAHVRENGFTTEVEAARLGKFWRHAPLTSFSHTQGRAGPGPLKGQHTQAILAELGYDGEQILKLREQRVVDWEEQ